MKTLAEISKWLDDEYPERDWDQWCSKLVWNVVWAALDWPDERTIRPYDPASAGYRASRIEALDPSTAPVGAIHWFQYPNPDGHVGVSLGGSTILMTGAAQAMTGGTMLGTNYGVTTVEQYVKAKGNRYLGWSRTFGTNQSIVGLIGSKATTPTVEEEEDDMWKPTVHVRVDGNKATEYTLAHPMIGDDLQPGEKRESSDSIVFRGYMVTTNPTVGMAWARMYANGDGGETSRGDRASYIAIQTQATRVSVELA